MGKSYLINEVSSKIFAIKHMEDDEKINQKKNLKHLLCICKLKKITAKLLQPKYSASKQCSNISIKIT